MKNFHITLFTFLLTLKCFSINENNPIGARSTSMANSSVSFCDLWSNHHNQAGLAFVKNFSGGFYYENRFLIKELGISAGCVALPVKVGVIGFSISNFGYSLYKESKYNLCFAKTFGEKFSIGMAMDYITTRISDGYGKKGIASAEIGIISKPLKDLTTGAHIFNPTRTKFVNYNNERLPTILRLGANYNFSDKVMVAFETEKNLLMKAIFKAGIEYKIIKELYLRAGISTNPSLSTFGFGINLTNFTIDFSANYHQVLGISPQLGVTYKMMNKKEQAIPNRD